MRSIGAGRSGWVFLTGIILSAAQGAVGCGGSHHNDNDAGSGGGSFAGSGGEAGIGSEPEGGAPPDGQGGSGGNVSVGGGHQGGAGAPSSNGGSVSGAAPGFPLGGSTGITLGGRTGAGGAGVGGSMFNTGGSTVGGSTAGCIDGQPCTCKKLTGVTVCDKDGNGTCDCPAAAECAAPTVTSCFDPCGGDPFGTWVLEDECFSGSAGDASNCHAVSDGMGNGSTLRVLFDDGGYYQVVGSERWSMHTRFNPECYGTHTVNQCPVLHPALDMLLFGYNTTGTCDANACGVCDCQTDVDSPANWPNGTWSRQGQMLTVNSDTVPYCVQDDVMWLGGTTSSGYAKVSYKFRRKSCVGTPTPCSARTKEQCASSPECVLGACTTTSGSHSARCDQGYSESSCSVIAGCEWHADGCTGEVTSSCTMDACDTQAGCSWSAPNPHCSGTPTPCSQIDTSTCPTAGCSVTQACVTSTGIDTVNCNQLSNTLCASAPGCTLVSNRCTGTANCSEQTSIDACSYLGCSYYEVCSGVAQPCTGTSVGECKQNPGCTWNW